MTCSTCTSCSSSKPLMEEKVRDSLRSRSSASSSSHRNHPIAKSSSAGGDSDLLNSSAGADRSGVSYDVDFSETANSSVSELSVSDGEVLHDHTAAVQELSTEITAGDSDSHVHLQVSATTATRQPGHTQHTRPLAGIHGDGHHQHSTAPMSKRWSYAAVGTGAAEQSSVASLTDSMDACSLDSTRDTSERTRLVMRSPLSKWRMFRTKDALTKQPKHAPVPASKQSTKYQRVSPAGPAPTQKKSSSGVAMFRTKDTLTKQPKHAPVPASKQSAKYQRVSPAGPAPTQKKSSSGVADSGAAGAAGQGDLTAWQLWLLKKTKQQRERREAKYRQEIVGQGKVAADQAAMAVQAQNADQAWAAWCMKSEREWRKEMDRAYQCALVDARRQEQQRQEVEERAKEAFDSWVAEKVEGQTKQKSAEQRRQEEKEAQTAERRSHADKAFVVWRDTAEHRLSYDRRQEMFDVLRAPLPPSYCNPLPWQPTVVTEKKMRKGKPNR